eukprot:2689205-Rhodomonas_salina.1
MSESESSSDDPQSRVWDTSLHLKVSGTSCPNFRTDCQTPSRDAPASQSFAACSAFSTVAAYHSNI